MLGQKKPLQEEGANTHSYYPFEVSETSLRSVQKCVTNANASCLGLRG